MRKRLRRTGKVAALGASATLALGITSQLHAAGPVRQIAGRYVSAATHQHAAAKVDTGLVIVPFAVPVAVPVATVQQPSVLYSYRQYVSGSLTDRTAPLPPAPLPQGERGDGSAATPDAAAVLARHCASCHRGTAAQGKVTLFDASGSLLSRLPRQAILEAIEQDRMPQPPTATRLTPQELDVLRTWAKPPNDLVY